MVMAEQLKREMKERNMACVAAGRGFIHATL
jgi:hypothetical protein